VYVGHAFDCEYGTRRYSQRWEDAVPYAGSQNELVESYRQCPSLSIEELWRRCFELGGMNTAAQLEAFVYGFVRLTPHEHNLIAVAMNEYFAEFDPGRFVCYMEDGYSNN
jgi:hypothetical protein